MKKLVICDSLGCRVSEESARMLDAIVKSLPKGNDYRPRRISKAATLEEANERTDVALITTGAVDLDNEIVDPDGIDLEAYLKTMIVLWNHDPDQPLGRCQWIKKVPNGLKAKTYYTPRPDNYEGEWTPDRVYALVQAGVVTGKSIGFVPVEIREPTHEEKSMNSKVECVITKSVMFEYSTVSTPCNTEALIQETKSLPIDLLGVKNVGRVVRPKPKPVDYKTPMAAALDAYRFDPERIADEVVQRLLHRGRV